MAGAERGTVISGFTPGLGSNQTGFSGVSCLGLWFGSLGDAGVSHISYSFFPIQQYPIYSLFPDPQLLIPIPHFILHICYSKFAILYPYFTFCIDINKLNQQLTAK